MQSSTRDDEPPVARLDLYWIPLGAGARVVRLSGRLYETLAALAQRRPRSDLYHSALVATVSTVRTVVEMAPIPDGSGRTARGVVAEGAVGLHRLRPLRVFRYEIRRWPAGVIPDLACAVSSPVQVADDLAHVQNVLDLVALVPTPVWGRDELGLGEMWNSNSVISWVLAHAGLLASAGRPPSNGRAPGWDAGVRAATRDIALAAKTGAAVSQSCTVEPASPTT